MLALKGSSCWGMGTLNMTPKHQSEERLWEWSSMANAGAGFHGWHLFLLGPGR